MGAVLAEPEPGRPGLRLVEGPKGAWGAVGAVGGLAWPTPLQRGTQARTGRGRAGGHRVSTACRPPHPHGQPSTRHTQHTRSSKRQSAGDALPCAVHPLPNIRKEGETGGGGGAVPGSERRHGILTHRRAHGPIPGTRQHPVGPR